jgi:hypothetical protein
MHLRTSFCMLLVVAMHPRSLLEASLEPEWLRLNPAPALSVCLLASTCSYDISTIASVIPAFASRQDLLVIDDGVSYPIQQVSSGHPEHVPAQLLQCSPCCTSCPTGGSMHTHACPGIAGSSTVALRFGVALLWCSKQSMWASLHVLLCAAGRCQQRLYTQPVCACGLVCWHSDCKARVCRVRSASGRDSKQSSAIGGVSVVCVCVCTGCQTEPCACALVQAQRHAQPGGPAEAD